MILADFKIECFRKLDAMGLGENKTYTHRLHEEMGVFEAQQNDYKGNLVDYFMNTAESTAKNGKIKNSNNLLTSFILGITDEDPIKSYVEMIKTKSAEFPDIDMDFEDAKRDLAKEYLVQKYGRDNVASIAAFGKMQAKAVIKDIGRVKGIPHEEINEITKIMGYNEPLEEAYADKKVVKAFFDKYEHMDLYRLCTKLNGNVRHISQHAAGVVIAPDNITNYCGLEKAKDKIITCWEEAGGSKELSKVGLIKFDILGLNTLTVIHEALNSVKKNHGRDIDIEAIDFYDPEIMKEFASGHTIGIFQFERDWVRMMLRKMNVTEFKDIAALNALNRPGPIEMGEKLWKTKAGQMRYSYLWPTLEPILKSTYCVIIYQEQIMEIAQKLAGFSADESDNFRKAMSSGKSDLAKGINPFEKYEKKFIDGCIKNGMVGRINVNRTIEFEIDMPRSATDIRVLEETPKDDGSVVRKISCNVDIADELFYQIKAFAGYGFNKAHAVEYSQIAVMGMFLKHYYPIEFMASLLSNTPNAISQNEKSKPNKFVDYFFEARRMKIKTSVPNINTSNMRFTPTADGIISGFNFIKGLGDNAINEIIKKRPFTDFDDFLNKVSAKNVNKSSVFALVHSGCFDDFIEMNGDKKLLHLRYGLINQYMTHRKLKDKENLIPKTPTAVDAIAEEAETCGDQIFNTLLDLVDFEKINQGYQVDDKIMPFSTLDKLNIGTTIRTFGVVNSYFAKPTATGPGVGFLTLKNGSRTHRIIIWSKDVDTITRHKEISDIFKPKTVITCRIKRDRDYKELKTFNLILAGAQKLL